MTCEHGAGFPANIAALLPAQSQHMLHAQQERQEEERLLAEGLMAQNKARGYTCRRESHLSDSQTNHFDWSGRNEHSD